MNVIDIILAIILPPLPVALRFGFGGKFWVNVILTILGYIPGLVHALVVLPRKDLPGEYRKSPKEN